MAVIAAILAETGCPLVAPPLALQDRSQPPSAEGSSCVRRSSCFLRSSSCSSPRALRRSQPVDVPFRQFRLANGLNVILHRDTSVPVVAVNVWYHVGSANEKPGRTGFAHLFEHLMFEGSKNVHEGRVRHAARGGRRRQQRLDERTTAPTTSSTCRERARAGAVSRVGSHGLSARHDDARSASTASATSSRTSGGRATRTGRTAWRRSSSTSCCGPPSHPYSWPTIGYMEDLTAASHDGRRRVLQDVLRAEQREPRHRRRHRLRPHAGARREVVRRDPARAPRRADRAAGRDADRRASGRR